MKPARRGRPTLSSFQVEVWKLALEGKSDTEIAAILNKNRYGIREALRHVYYKCNVRGRRELIIQHYEDRIRELETQLMTERGRNVY